MKTTRRLFLKRGGIALVSVGMAPSMGPLFLSSTAFAEEPQRAGQTAGGKKILVCIFQRGAVDGMSMVVPHGDADYYRYRVVGPPGIALARTGPDGVIDLDGRFGLHPALAALKPIYDAGHLAPIHACGSPNATRSHFDAQDFMESGAPGNKTVGDGWLARTVRSCPEDNARLHGMFRAVTMTPRVPRSLMGDSEALAIPDLHSFGIKITPDVAAQRRQRRMQQAREEARAIGADDGSDDGSDSLAAPAPPPLAAIPPGREGQSLVDAFQALYDTEGGDVLHGAGAETFEALKVVKKINAAGYVPANGAHYPNGSLGESLQQIAQLIKSDVGLEIAFAEAGGWDTHANQGAAQGRLANNLRQFGQSLAAFYTDLGDRMGDVVVLTMSEFGRTARQNGNGGTDHGHATCFLAMGGPINGGRVLGQWPGLAPEQLYENRDLAVTTDFRNVFGEVAQRHLGVRDLTAVFPDYTVNPARFRGVLKA